MTTLHAALEIGTTHTVLAIGEMETGSRPRITCLETIPSAGVRKSTILDIDQATQSIRGVLQSIERRESASGNTITIGNAFLIISGQHIHADHYTGLIQINGSRVTEDDIRNVQDAAHSQAIAKDREMLEVAEQDYVIDSMGGISSPNGMAGRVLKLNTLQIHADHNRIEDARTATEGAKLEVREPLFAATCAAEAVLEEHEKKNGVLVIDMGGGSTGYAAYCDGYLVSTGVLGVGGDHITNDIAHAFQTTQSQADELKRTCASAMVRPVTDDSNRIKLPGFSPLLDNKTISSRSLDTVVNARLRELMAMLRERLEEQDLMQRLHSGVILTGGAAAMLDVSALVERELGMNTRIGRPLHVDGLDGYEFPAQYAAIAGALAYALKNYEEKPFLGGIFGGLFK